MQIVSLSGMDRNTGRPATGNDHLRQSIMDILLTPLGSRVCNRDYGSSLPDLIDAPTNEAGIQSLYAATAIAISRQYPQFAMTKVLLESDQPTDGQMTLCISGYERNTGMPVNDNPPIELRLPLNLNAPFLN